MSKLLAVCIALAAACAPAAAGWQVTPLPNNTAYLVNTETREVWYLDGDRASPVKFEAEPARAPAAAAQPAPKPQAQAAVSPAPAPRQAPATSGQCAATTQKGTRCKRAAKPGSAYCWQHGN